MSTNRAGTFLAWSMVVYWGQFALAQSGADPCIDRRGADDGLPIVVYTEYESPKRDSKRATRDGVIVTNRLDEFRYLKSRMQATGAATASVSVLSCSAEPQVAAANDGKTPRFVCNPGGGGGPVEPFPGSIEMSLLVYDETTLAEWANTNFVPAFMNEVIADPPPSLEEAAFDIDFVLWDTAETLWIGKFRVRRSDGAIGLVSLQTIQPEEGFVQDDAELAAACPGAGPYYGWCCLSQAVSCQLLRLIPFIGPLLCPSCTSCASDCAHCCVPNPCHSCGGCGLTWLFNRFGVGSS